MTAALVLVKIPHPPLTLSLRISDRALMVF